MNSVGLASVQLQIRIISKAGSTRVGLATRLRVPFHFRAQPSTMANGTLISSMSCVSVLAGTLGKTLSTRIEFPVVWDIRFGNGKGCFSIGKVDHLFSFPGILNPLRTDVVGLVPQRPFTTKTPTWIEDNLSRKPRPVCVYYPL